MGGKAVHSQVTSSPCLLRFVSFFLQRPHLFFLLSFFPLLHILALLFRPLKVSESAETWGSKEEKGRAPFSQRAFITLYWSSCQNSSVPVSPLLRYKSSFVTVNLYGPVNPDHLDYKLAQPLWIGMRLRSHFFLKSLMFCLPLTGSYKNKVESFFITPRFGFSMAFPCSHDCTWLSYLTSSNVTLSVTFLMCV